MAQINSDFFWQAATWADWLGCELRGDKAAYIYGVTTDSRTTRPGDAYFAVIGERFDGHDFAEAAVENGASVLVVNRLLDLPVTQLVVDDTRLALGQVAKQHRLSQPLHKLIAVTGSNGKTTVKTMLAHILGMQAPTLATQGNLNNDFGVPRTLLEIRPHHRYAVIEMGANHLGEIGYLTQLGCPDVAMITLAADAHLEGFGSLQGIIDTKGEIFNGLTAKGIGIINTDSPGYEQWQASLSEHPIWRFGRAEAADVRVLDVQSQDKGLVFSLSLKGEEVEATLPVMGVHNAMNAAAATAACLAIGLTWAQIQPALATFTGVQGRLQTYELQDEKLQSNALLIDDSYNANPSSVMAAMDTLSTRPGYRVFCLGQMAELGDLAEHKHYEVGEYAKQKGIDCLLTYGDLTAASQKGFGAQTAMMSHEQMIERLAEILVQYPEVNILIKGSRSAQMERVVQGVLARFKHAHLS